MRLNFIAFFVITIAIVGCHANGSTEVKTNNAPSYPVVTLQVKDTTLQQGYVTDIEAIRNVEIRAKVTGYIDKILVDEGQEVKKGQPLFLINDAEYGVQLSKTKAGVASAMAELKAAELEQKRVKTLVDKNVLAKSEFELAEVKINAAQARVSEARSMQDEAQIKLGHTYIRAPFSGIINRIPLKLGSLVNEGTLLTTVSDQQAVYAYFNVSENEYLKYAAKKHDAAKQVVALTLSDGSAYPYAGEVETMDGEFDENTGSIAFRAKFPNPNKLLKHGASGKVYITTDVKNALIIPQKAVFEIQDKNFVFVVDKNNTVKMKSFVPSTRIDEFIIVQSGLAVGENIVYEGVQNIREGIRITPKPVVMDSLYTIADL
jgi:membrane fusion protein (multidrug efflux system)